MNKQSCHVLFSCKENEALDVITTQVDQSNSWIRSDPIGILWGSDAISLPGIRSDFIGCSDPTRSDQIQYRIDSPENN